MSDLRQRLTRLLRELASCWRDPDASPELAAQYRGRQFQAVLGQLHLAGIGSVVTAVTFAFVFWDKAGHAQLVVWTVALAAIALFNESLSRQHRSDDPHATASVRATWLLTLDLSIAALLYCLMAIYLFDRVDEHGRLIVIAVVAAFIATGSWMYSCLPQAGVTWAVVLCVGPALGLVANYGSKYIYLVALQGFFCIVMVVAILSTSRIFMARIRAETEAARQAQLVDLLLRDFEESASDWLWEIDAGGRLRHASARLGEAIGMDPAQLPQQSLIDLIGSTYGADSGADREMLTAFERLLQAQAPFRDAVVPVMVLDERRWWSMTAKPLLDANGRFEGWRGVGSDITAARLRELQITRLANTDTLTGLSNRHQFSNALEQYFDDHGALRPCALFLIDLDNFKTINDSLGHSAGDLLLQEVARRLAAVSAPDELLTRLGGDEFAIIVPRELSHDDAQLYGDRLLSSLGQAWEIDGHSVMVRASIGVAFAPRDASDATELLKVCDMALYAAKAAGRQTLRFYESHMDAQSRLKLSILSDLGEGLRRAEFFLEYQPQIELASGKLVGFEALVRWRHPRRGVISPLEFIPIAEESGLILGLGDWVMRQACEHARFWPENLRISVNVSAAQFTNSDVLGLIDEVLNQTGMGSNRLEIEITESVMMQHNDRALHALRSLRKQGVRIALDDFGTGYSSLSYLRNFPLDKLKIDRSFIVNLDDRSPDINSSAIVQSIIQLASALHLETTAEGVETVGQRETLRRAGCKQAQGALIAAPMDSVHAASFIREWSRASA